MSKKYEKIEACAEYIKSKINFTPKAAVVLGSGLGDFVDRLKVCHSISYSEIPGFPTSSVQGHAGRFVFAYVGKLPVVIMQGRVHYYEGYAMEDVVLPIRVMRQLGAEYLILTNAAGGVNYDFHGGDLMMITDQIAQFVPSPLRGENVEEMGERFSDMTHIYDPELQKVIRRQAEKLGIPLREGVYIQMSGPNYESPAEVRMCRILGADAVGMSTACEAVAANHCGMRIAGISFISNLASGMTDNALSHKEVQEASLNIQKTFGNLVSGILEEIAELEKTAE